MALILHKEVFQMKQLNEKVAIVTGAGRRGLCHDLRLR